jgi:hypothetical protein
MRRFPLVQQEPNNVTKVEGLVSAGAYLSLNEKLKDDSIVDHVSARLYCHPALGSRTVVRLTADNLAEGDDLTMEFLGFTPPVVTGPIARRQRQALGFPGWAIINDPQHARYALELVKEFKQAVRRSRAKPGFGFEDFAEISLRLGKSVAHFLPSFWEQAGREFLAFDNATYGSRAFGKAREAEKVHALKVDENLRQHAFLEFALAGAVSIKALTDYGKQLSSTHDPLAAWKFFRELCVRRTLGGMPPWTSMVKDLQPLIKAAGLNVEEQIQFILLEMIDSPAISRATTGFWRSVSKSIAPLVKQDQHVAGILLNLIPQTSSWQTEDIWAWLEHLKTWGILANAWQEGAPEAARPAGGSAAWLTRLRHTFNQPRQPFFEILEAMAARLRNEKIPVDLYSKNRWNKQVIGDVDLIDLALELKIPFLDVPEQISLDLKKWAVPADPAQDLKQRPRDPVHLAADPRFNEALRKAVQTVAGESAFEAAAAGKMALSAVRHDWLSSLVEGLTNGALPRVEASLQVLEGKTRTAIFQEFPDILEKLMQADVRPAIARTLRTGLLDEYGWPALERVFEGFVTTNKISPLVFGHFPYLILTDRLKTVVLLGEEIVHEAELKLPAGHELKCLVFVDGDLLVWSGKNHQVCYFWNGDPQPSELDYNHYNPDLRGTSIDVAAGGTFIGEMIVHRGKKGLDTLRPANSVFCDGTHWWLRTSEYEGASYVQVISLRELDPATGKRGRRSMPAFLEDFVQDGSPLDLHHCSLLPLDVRFSKSPLGTHNGLAGFRVRHSDSDTSIEGIDGRACRVSQRRPFEVLLDQPGTNAHLPVSDMQVHMHRNGFILWDPTGSYEASSISGGGDGYNRGQITGLPPLFFHAFQVRDVAVSKKLRSISDEQVQVLLNAEQQDLDNFTQAKLSNAPDDSGSNGNPNARLAITNVMQKLTLRDEVVHSIQLDKAIHQLLGNEIHPRLLLGLRGVLIRAGQKRRQVAKLVDDRSSITIDQKSAVEIASADAVTAPYLASIKYGFRPLPHLSFAESATNAAKFFMGTSRTIFFPKQWLEHLRQLTMGVAQRMWCAYCTDPADQRWIPFAEIWSDLPYYTLPGWFRIFVGENRDKDFLAAEKATLTADVLQTGQTRSQVEWGLPYLGKSSRFLMDPTYRGYEVLEYSPDGKFESIPGLTEIPKSELIIPPSVWSPDQLRKFIGLTKSNPINFPSVALLKSLASETNASVAELAQVWFGLPKFEDYSVNFMPAHLRESCKLKTKECTTAKVTLKTMPSSDLHSLVRAVIQGDPADLWEQPAIQVADRIRAAWQREEPDKIPLSADWLERLSHTLGSDVDRIQFFQALNAPQTHSMLSATSTWVFVHGRSSAGLKCDSEGSQFNQQVLRAVANTIPLMAYGLPVGDPARNQLAAIYHATLKALANPGLLLSAGCRYDYTPESQTKLRQLAQSLVGKPEPQNQVDVADDGLTVVACNDHQLHIAFRPSQIASKVQSARLSDQLDALLFSKDSENFNTTNALQHVRIIHSANIPAMLDRIQQTPVPAGDYETNPLHSIPELVLQVAKKLKVSSAAAVYYLQLLSLPDPTDKNVSLWNGWKTAQIKTLGTELLQLKLVLEATRARAGRRFFLPGGWEELKAPHLPIETWKLPLFQIFRDVHQRITFPIGGIIPLDPVHEHFAKAWKRYMTGNVPKYDEVK